MSKTAQRNQSAFNVGKLIGNKMAKSTGRVNKARFNMLFGDLYKGAKRFRGIALKAARIGYLNTLDKAAQAAYLKARDTQLTGGKDA